MSLLKNIFFFLGLTLTVSAFAEDNILIKQVPPASENEKNIPYIAAGDLHFHGAGPRDEQVAVFRNGLPELDFNVTRLETSIRDWVIGGIDRARAIVYEGFGQITDSSLTALYDQVHAQFDRMVVHWPNAGYDYTRCGSTTLAYTFVGDNNVYLCRRMITEAVWQTNELAQTLIHEAAHNVGYGNECDATSIEVGAMRRSSIGLTYKNGYYFNCGFQ